MNAQKPEDKVMIVREEPSWYARGYDVLGYNIPYLVLILLIVVILYMLYNRNYTIYSIPGVSYLTTSETSAEPVVEKIMKGGLRYF